MVLVVLGELNVPWSAVSRRCRTSKTHLPASTTVEVDLTLVATLVQDRELPSLYHRYEVPVIEPPSPALAPQRFAGLGMHVMMSSVFVA